MENQQPLPANGPATEPTPEPVQPQPAQPQPAQPESAPFQPVPVQPIQAGPVQAETAKSELSKPEPSQTEPPVKSFSLDVSSGKDSGPAMPVATAPQPSLSSAGNVAASVTAAPVSTNPPATPKSGMKKWMAIGAGVLVVGGLAAAGLYFGGFLGNRTSESNLKGAAETSGTTSAPASMEEKNDESENSQEQKINTPVVSTTQQLSSLTQIALNACPVGQVKDPVSNLCTCDRNNNYFDMNLAGAFGKPTTGQASVVCTTCAALSDEILKLGQSNIPEDIARKNELNTLAKDQNCTPCAVFDDRIADALQKKQWSKYYELVLEKSQDKTCGRSLNTCDSLKWQSMFLTDLRAKAEKDTQSSAEEVDLLKEQQQKVMSDLANNTACFQLEALCTQLKTAYTKTANAEAGDKAAVTETGTSSEQVVTSEKKGTSIGVAPLQGKSTDEKTATGTATSQQSSSSQQPAGSEDGMNVDFALVNAEKLFDNNFYIMHCPVDQGGESDATTSTAPAVKKVKRSQS